MKPAEPPIADGYALYLRGLLHMLEGARLLGCARRTRLNRRASHKARDSRHGRYEHSVTEMVQVPIVRHNRQENNDKEERGTHSFSHSSLSKSFEEMDRNRVAQALARAQRSSQPMNKRKFMTWFAEQVQPQGPTWQVNASILGDWLTVFGRYGAATLTEAARPPP
jgi:hypothetical protein